MNNVCKINNPVINDLQLEIEIRNTLIKDIMTELKESYVLLDNLKNEVEAMKIEFYSVIRILEGYAGDDY